MQLTEGQPGVGANRYVAVQGELREDELRLNRDYLEPKCTPEAVPAVENCGRIRIAGEDRGQLETLKCREDGLH